jgi:hypothetical protein
MAARNGFPAPLVSLQARGAAAAWLENVGELRMHETVQREVRFAGIVWVAGFWCWLTPWCLPNEPPFPR